VIAEERRHSVKLLTTILTLALVLEVASFAVGESVVSIKDVSSEGSPISTNGTVTFTDTVEGKWRSFGQTYSVIGQNSARQGIVALVLEIDTTDLRGAPGQFILEDDYYFKEGEIPPGEDFTIADSSDQAKESPFGPKIGAPTADLKVTFVQFSDETIWGNQDVARKMIADRKAAREFLENLLDIYQQRGELAFLEVVQLKKPHQASIESILHHLRETYAKSGTPATLSKIRRALRCAAQRSLAMNLSPSLIC
jgi:hypothetical protein